MPPLFYHTAPTKIAVTSCVTGATHSALELYLTSGRLPLIYHFVINWFFLTIKLTYSALIVEMSGHGWCFLAYVRRIISNELSLLGDYCSNPCSSFSEELPRGHRTRNTNFWVDLLPRVIPNSGGLTLEPLDRISSNSRSAPALAGL